MALCYSPLNAAFRFSRKAVNPSFMSPVEARSPNTADSKLAAFADASRAGELDAEEGYLAVVQKVRETTGAGGRRLFHPLRLAISGRDSGPELKQVIPLLEAGARLPLEPEVAGVAARIERALDADDGP